MENQLFDGNEELETLEEAESYKDDFADLPPNDIVAYNELRSCADLFRMYDTKQLEIQPDFQRDIVWKTPAQSRFIDSLMKQLPIPSLCISLDYRTDKRLVIDGLQRIKSIINFLSDDEWKLSELDDIDNRISGKTVHTIKTKTKDLYERVQNVTIPVTVIRCDYSKASHNEYLFTIFHRLNTGGNKLNNQEIRNCIYNGSLNTLLKKLADNETFNKLIAKEKNERFSNEEQILRFYAFYNNLDTYEGRLAKFLNDYMQEHRYADDKYIQELEKDFHDTINLIYNKITDKQPIGKISKATLEGLLIGVASNLNTLQSKSSDDVKIMYAQFRALPEYSTEKLKEGLAAKEKVQSRLHSAIDIFSK